MCGMLMLGVRGFAVPRRVRARMTPTVVERKKFFLVTEISQERERRRACAEPGAQAEAGAFRFERAWVMGRP